MPAPRSACSSRQRAGSADQRRHGDGRDDRQAASLRAGDRTRRGRRRHRRRPRSRRSRGGRAGGAASERDADRGRMHDRTPRRRRLARGRHQPQRRRRAATGSARERASHDDGDGRHSDPRIPARAADVPPPAGDVRARRRRAAATTRTVTSISTCSRASASPRLATRIRDSPRRSRIRPRRCSTRRTCSSTRCRVRWPNGSSTLSGLPRAFFCNSGAEAVEACLKFARRYWYTRGEPRSEFVALRGVVPRPHVRRAVGDLRRALSRAVRAAARRRPLGAGQRSGGAPAPRCRDRRRRSSSRASRVRAASGR